MWKCSKFILVQKFSCEKGQERERSRTGTEWSGYGAGKKDLQYKFLRLVQFSVRLMLFKLS